MALIPVSSLRDYLRTHPEIAQDYGRLKKLLAKTCENDLERYCDGKDAYVKHLEMMAVKEKELNESGQLPR